MTLAAFRAAWPELLRYNVDGAISSSASTVAERFLLRGFDAIHLATALHHQALADEPLTFATFDRRLWAAASESGLEAWPPQFA